MVARILAAWLCLWGVAQAGSDREVKVLVDDNLAALPILIGLERNYFASEGVRVAPVRMRLYTEGKAAALAKGSLDVALMAYTTTLNDIMPQAGFRIVADGGRAIKGRRKTMYILVRKDLAPTVRDFADLKGRSVGLPVPGAPIYLAVLRGLAQAGLSIRDVDVRPMPSAQSLRDKMLDVGVFWEPLAGRLVKRGIAEVFAGSDLAEESGQMAAVFFSKNLLERKPTAVRFLSAYLRCLREFQASSPAQLKAAADKYLPEPTELEDFAPLHFSADGSVDTGSIMRMQQEAVAFGLIKAPVAESAIFDFSPLRQAQHSLAGPRR
jgi:NitT/TauT family transport system substrate-binding protein